MGSIGELFLNEGQDDKTVVQAPAFSITKVMVVAAPLFTAAVTAATAQFDLLKFTSGQMTALLASLIGFFALTVAADVIARGIATSAEKTAAGRNKWVQFHQPLAGRLMKPEKNEEVSVLAASNAQPPEFLCLRDDKTLSWEPAAIVYFT